jgi:hypothetical protein
MKKGMLLSLVIFIALAFSSLTVMAQTPPPTNGAPIDTAIGALLVAVAAYGYRSLKQEKKNE